MEEKVGIADHDSGVSARRAVPSAIVHMPSIMAPKLRAADLDREIKFCTHGLGMNVLRWAKYEGFFEEVALDFEPGSVKPSLVLLKPKDGAPTVTHGDAYVATVVKVPDLEAAAAKLSTAGYQPDPIYQSEPYAVLFVKDPEGFTWELLGPPTPRTASSAIVSKPSILAPKLRAADLDREIKFCTDGLGMYVLGRFKHEDILEEVMLAYDKGAMEPSCVLFKPKDGAPTVTHGDAYIETLVTVPDLEATAAKLTAAGYSPEKILQADPYAMFHVKDPEGFTWKIFGPPKPVK
jgi:catechol 2,3-dioxygenase-like lactoylglutathione lyase family enzyme/uncharacterized glyoxalase superfamily protein PhnB